MKQMLDFIYGEAEYRNRCSIAFRKCCYGDKNKKQKFRILCNRSRWANKQGLLSTMFEILPNIIEAREHGYIPAVDLCMNSRSSIMLQEQYLAKKENAWEYYFTQPERKSSLDEIRQSKYVEEQIKSSINHKYYIGDKVLQETLQTKYLSLAIRQNIHLQQKIKNRVISEKCKLLSQTDRVLGVGIRAGYRLGALANISIFNGHPIVGTCIDYIKSIEKRLSRWKYDSFFLEVDDRKYLEEIKKYFGSSCIYLDRPRMHYFKNALEDIPCMENDERLIEFKGTFVRGRNEDYLVELYLLAQCDSLYASRGTGHNFSYLLNSGKYTHVEFTDLGNFHYK